ncbi:MAG: cupin domain-containing protein [Desulfobacterales bacterium]
MDPFHPLTKTPPRTPAPGIELRAIHGERMSLAHFRFAPGTPLAAHAHPHEQMGMLLQGRMELTIGGVTRTVAAGEAWWIPAGTVHSARCLEGPAEVVEAFAPVRDDWRNPVP